MSLRSKILSFLAISFIIPISLNFIVYYGFVSNYPAKIYEVESLKDELGYGVYKHRILGNVALLAVNDIVSQINFPDNIKTFERIKSFLEVKDLSLYHSYFILNTIFLVLTASVLFMFFNLTWIKLGETEKFIYQLLITVLICISQFVTLHYDVMSYFLIVLCVYTIVTAKNITSFIVLLLFLIAGALTRETIILVIAFHLLTLVKYNEWGFYTNVIQFYIINGVFIATFLLVCFINGFDGFILNRIMFPENIIAPQNLLGFLFMLAVTYLLMIEKKSRTTIMSFLFVSIPYLIVLLLTGIMFEIRLWIPMIILMIIVSVIAKSKNADEVEYKWGK